MSVPSCCPICIGYGYIEYRPRKKVGRKLVPGDEFRHDKCPNCVGSGLCANCMEPGFDKACEKCEWELVIPKPVPVIKV